LAALIEDSIAAAAINAEKNPGAACEQVDRLGQD
jgi:hypothetical protein